MSSRVAPPPANVARAVALKAPAIWSQLGRALDRSGVRGIPGITWSSWFRTYARNRDVGGSGQSQHLLGLAFDFAGDRASMERAAAGLRSAGFLVVDEGDHIHAQAWPSGAARRAGLL